MNSTYQLIDTQYKDESPIKTVQKIKNLLSGLGIATRELWHETRVPYCHAVTVLVEGTTFSVNGKGLTRELTLASGYGELMERLQMGYLGSQDIQKDGDYAVQDAVAQTASARELYLANPRRYAQLAESFTRLTGAAISPEEVLSGYADGDGTLAVTPFYNVTKKTADGFPAILRRYLYSANGCAAGNTMEEAMVQAISEIVERHHHMRAVCENMTLPEIPESVLERYGAAMEIIRFVRSAGYRVTVKDCSLGTRFPVVCVCFIHEKTGKYHTHFGAYPVFEIALERALTETFQGRSLDNFASFADFSLPDANGTSLLALANEMTKGTWEKRPEFFVGEPAFPWREDVGFTGGNNRELLRECLDFIQSQGYEILARDCSCMGFPTCQILVPGYSEAYAHRLSPKENDQRYGVHAARTLRNPASASLEDRMGLLMHTAQMSRLSGNITKAHGFLAGARLSAKLTPAEDNALLAASMAYVYFALGRTGHALKRLDAILPGKSVEETARLICLKRYLSLEAARMEKEKISEVLAYFHDAGTVAWLCDSLRNGNPLEPFVLRCDGTCPADCPLAGKCCQKRVEELTAAILSGMSSLDFSAIEGLL